MRHGTLSGVILVIFLGAGCTAMDQALDPATTAGPGWWSWALPSALAGEEVVTSRGTVLQIDPTMRPVPRDERPRPERGDTIPRRPDVERDDRDEGEEDDGWDDRRERERERERGRGEVDHDDVPPFCRNGEGHPRFGMEWCYEKGYMGGRSNPAYEGVPAFCRTGEGHPVFGHDWCRERAYERSGPADWRVAEIERVRLPAPDRYGMLGERELGRLLGGALLDRLDRHGERLGASGDLRGVVLVPDGRSDTTVLQLRKGGVALAELSDLDGDGILDVALVMD